ncbi:MAG TPA: tetratricopeptide repeat protein [Terriglobia bacterium]|nr:tetratricopeptide repeat protein [Terriglobia bacterium]
MSEASSRARPVRFGAFELDLRSRELRKQGSKITLQDQPFQVLALLIERAGEVVAREDLRGKLWPADTFVDFEDGLNTAVKKIRTALGDSADNPQFVETLPRRGYRFIAPVEHAATRTGRDEGGEVAAVAPARAAGQSSISSVAVLPLLNLSGDPAQEYFADGMTEALTTNLAQIRALRVISRTSAMKYKHTSKSMPEIGRELNVEGVVEGAVSRSHDHVRVTAQLIHAPADAHLWAKTYEREIHDVLFLQSEVALAIATEVHIRLSSTERARLSTSRSVKPEALEAYLMGRYFWSRRTEEALTRAIDYFQQAIQEDPDYAQAYAGLADCYTMLAWNSMRPPKEALPKGKAAALTALGLDEHLAEAHSSLAVTLMFHDWDWEGAEGEFKRSIELNPSYGVARPWYAFELAALGRHVEAGVECQRALRIDPLSLPILASSAFVFYLARQYDHSLDLSRRMLEMDPTGFYQAYFVLGTAYEPKGMWDQALRAFESAVAISNRNPHMLAGLGHARAASGQTAGAREVLDELRERAARQYIAPFNLAMVYAGLGLKEEALDWLERAYEDRSIWMIFVDAFPLFDRLRPEPRFQSLTRRMGFPP